DPNDSNMYTVSGIGFDPVSVADNCGIASIQNDFNNSGSLDGASFPTGVTTITWSITDIAGNINTCSFNISVNTTGIGGLLERNNISIYPNPTDDKLNIEFINDKERQITISDLTGRNLLMKPLANKKEIIDISSFTRGIYIISIFENSEVATYSIVKE
ncbi:MAG: T9SS type A sorting domain-containing protein, partial [Candidatus Paceibacterota bacterium]